jgi:uncharacterized protein
MNESSEFSICFERKLIDLIKQHKLLFSLLVTLKKIEPVAYLSAGVIRNTIWSYLHAQEFDLEGTEVDVIYFDPTELNYEKSKTIQQQLEHAFPVIDWDVTNQALVHTWYKTSEGQNIQAYTSLIHAITNWPETATAIAVRMNEENDLEIIAPLGLGDLFNLRLRWNSQGVAYEVFQRRIKEKNFLIKWPKLKLVQ